MKGLRRTKEEEVNTFGYQPNNSTTALCCAANIDGIPITLIIDSGASGSVVSKSFLDDHNLKIERPSTVTMTNINGVRSVPLGAIDNFPITIGTATIPIKVDVTESTTYSVIAGNDWLRLVQATIDYSTASLTIRHEQKVIHIPCTYQKDNNGPMVHPPPQSQTIVPNTSTGEVDPEDSEDEEEPQYLMNTTEIIGHQERSLEKIKWGPLPIDELRYLPRQKGVMPQKHGIAIGRNLHTWDQIQMLHANLQRTRK